MSALILRFYILGLGIFLCLMPTLWRICLDGFIGECHHFCHFTDVTFMPKMKSIFAPTLPESWNESVTYTAMKQK